MAIFEKKISPRRQKYRATKSAERAMKLRTVFSVQMKLGLVIVFLFSLAATALMSVNTAQDSFGWMGFRYTIAVLIITLMITGTACAYVFSYNRNIANKPTRTVSLCGLFLILLGVTKIAGMNDTWLYLVTGTAVLCAITLTITYNQRFAFGMSLFYAVLACLALPGCNRLGVFATMLAGIAVCCFSLHDIRTRMKLIQVSTYAAIAVVIMSFALGLLDQQMRFSEMIGHAGSAGFITFFIGVIIQGFLPVIERVFNVATSMTLLFYSDASQPLLRKLAMEAPGTFSHSLLIGSVAEKAADAIGANGLLARVGCYYHDVGKIEKPSYFVENQGGNDNKHDALSPTMSNLVITNHTKNGIEMAREYGIPPILRDFISTHHGTTIVQYFYEEAKRKAAQRGEFVSETEFRYPGPKPQTKEQAIVMLVDGCEGAVRAAQDLTQPKIKTIVHNISMKRLQDGQFDDCEMTLKELSIIENAITNGLAAHHHGRIAYPDSDEPGEKNGKSNGRKNGTAKPAVPTGEDEKKTSSVLADKTTRAAAEPLPAAEKDIPAKPDVNDKTAGGLDKSAPREGL